MSKQNLKTYEVKLRVVRIVVSEIEAESESKAWNIAEFEPAVCDGQTVEPPEWSVLSVEEVW